MSVEVTESTAANPPEAGVEVDDRLRKLEKVVASLNVQLLELQEENRYLKEEAVPKEKYNKEVEERKRERDGLVKEREEMATIILQLGESFGLDYGDVDILTPPESLVGHLQYVCEFARKRLGEYKEWIHKFDHWRQSVPCDYPGSAFTVGGDNNDSSIMNSDATELSGITTKEFSSSPVAEETTPEPVSGQREGNWTTWRSDPPLDADSLEVLSELERYDMDDDETASPQVPSTSEQTQGRGTTSTSTTGKRRRGRKKGQGARKDNSYRLRSRFANSKVTHQKVTIASNSPTKAPFRCSCGKVYKHRANLTDHLRKMTEEWKFPCKPCRWFFFYESDLRKHRRKQSCIYSQERGSWTPSVAAGNAFSRFPRRLSSNRVSPRGMPVLTKEQSYPPPIPMPIMVSSDSEDDGEVPSQPEMGKLAFHCDMCGKQFGKVHGLKRHLASVHNQVEPLKDVAVGCRACGNMFRSKEEFLDHRRLEHARSTRAMEGQMEVEPPELEESQNDEETIPVLDLEEEAVNSPSAP